MNVINVMGLSQRVMHWLVIASVPVFSLAALGSLFRDHVSSAVWFAAIALFDTWLLIRPRFANRPEARGQTQVRRMALLTMLGLDVVGLAGGVLAILWAVQTSGGARIAWVTSAVVAFILAARFIHITMLVYKGSLPRSMYGGEEDRREI